MTWVTDMEERLIDLKLVDNLGMCDCGSHHVIHVNPDGLQALYILLAAFMAETELKGDVDDLPDHVVSQVADFPVELQEEALKAVVTVLNHHQQAEFDSSGKVVLEVIRNFVPELEIDH